MVSLTLDMSKFHLSHCVKSAQIRSFFWSVFSRIQSKYRKIRTRKNSVFGHFSRTVILKFCWIDFPVQKLALTVGHFDTWLWKRTLNKSARERELTVSNEYNNNLWVNTCWSFSAWCPLKGHTYLNKLAAESCRFI